MRLRRLVRLVGAHRLRELELESCTSLQDSDLGFLARLPALEVVSLVGCFRLTAPALVDALQGRCLRRLSVDGVRAGTPLDTQLQLVRLRSLVSADGALDVTAHCPGSHLLSCLALVVEPPWPFPLHQYANGLECRWCRDMRVLAVPGNPGIPVIGYWLLEFGSVPPGALA